MSVGGRQFSMHVKTHFFYSFISEIAPKFRSIFISCIRTHVSMNFITILTN